MCHKCQACHANRRRMSPSATLARQNEARCRQMPRLPRKTKVDVAKCHACYTKVPRRHRRPTVPKGATRPSQGSSVPAPPDPAQCHKCHTCHAKRRSMSPSATLATQNAGGCRQAPRLPRKRRCVTKRCVKDGVCDKEVCERGCVKDSV